MEVLINGARVLSAGFYGEDRGEVMKRPNNGTPIGYVDVYDQNGGDVIRWPVSEGLNDMVDGLRDGAFVDMVGDIRLQRDARSGSGPDSRGVVVEKTKVSIRALTPAQERLPQAV